VQMASFLVFEQLLGYYQFQDYHMQMKMEIIRTLMEDIELFLINCDCCCY